MNRVVFMGTPDFAVPSLETLIESQHVVGVVTQPDRPAGRGRQLLHSPVKQVALQAGISLYQPTSLRTEEAADPLREWNPDVIVVAAFGQILRSHVLDLPLKGCINVHASLLPRWRGASPIQHAILAGDAQSGITLMKMDVGLDTGPIYIQEAIAIAADETSASLHNRLATLGGQLLKTHLESILQGHLPAQAQNDDLATYAPMIKKAAGRIDWQQEAAAIDRQVRAMTPWPGAFTEWNGRNLKVLEGHPRSDVNLNLRAGETAYLGSEIAVQTAEGVLILDRVQMPGKKPLSAEAFARGQAQFVGIQLGQ